MAYKQKPMTFGEGTGDPKVKSTDYLMKTPSIVASERAKQDYEGTDGSSDSEEDDDKETARINTTPNTKPPLFSDDAHGKTHNIAANITEGSIQSQNLRRKENEKKKKK